jgi:murein DD-endopeptidase MepM/ murein hydrolase activator NlpD
VVLLAVVVLIVVGGPASAQDNGGSAPPATTTSTTDPTTDSTADSTGPQGSTPTTEPGGDSTTSSSSTPPPESEPDQSTTTVGDPGTAEPATSEPPPTDPSTTTGGTGGADGADGTDETGEPDQDGTETTLPEDPMSNEAPGEEAPGVDLTVPPKTTYAGQEPFKPAQILWSSVAAAERKLNEAVAARQEAIVEVRHLRKRDKELATIKRSLDADTAAAIEELELTEDRLSTRAVFGFQRFGSGSATDRGPLPEVSDQRALLESRRRSKMVGSALDTDEADIGRLDSLRDRLGVKARGTLARSRLVVDLLGNAESEVADIEHEIDQATIEYRAFRAGSEIYIHGVVFPIAGAYSTPLIDSYGFPRMPGTPDEHWHEGIDLFAAKGTPLVATERGIITKLGVGRLGGLKFWLKGESGTEWYYAHLDGFAPGLADGVVVDAGQLVGYVGNTGNALTTPPHLHMQVHPGGGDPVNPYPLLKVVSDLELAEISAGTHPGYRYQANVSD